MSIPRPFGIRRGPVLMALVLAAVAVIPVAIAMACNPQAYLTLDKASYVPGDTVKVSGSFFRASTAITVSLDRTGQSATVTSSSNGSLSTSFALPASAPTGGYSVSATGIDPDTGGVINGLPARSSFVVANAVPASTPAPASDATGQPGTPAASSPQASAPADQPAATATRPTQRPTSSTNARTWREPAVTSEPDVQRSTTRPAAQNGTAPRPERATANGRAVFGGSVAPAVSATTAVAPAVTSGATATRSTQKSGARPSSSSSRPARVSPQAAEQTAADDVWGAVTSGRSPSVLPVAGDGVAVSSPRAGSQLALGIMMLGAGALALLGGLAFGEARRRRVRAS